MKRVTLVWVQHYAVVMNNNQKAENQLGVTTLAVGVSEMKM